MGGGQRGSRRQGQAVGVWGVSEPRLCDRDGEEGTDLREVKAVESRCFHGAFLMA